MLPLAEVSRNIGFVDGWIKVSKTQDCLGSKEKIIKVIIKITRLDEAYFPLILVSMKVTGNSPDNKRIYPFKSKPRH